MALMAINNDGTDLMPYFGNHESPVFKEMVYVSGTDDRVYYVESDTLLWLGGGSIAEISQSRPLHSYRCLTAAQAGIFHSPCALPDDKLIASYRANETGPFGLYYVDANDGRVLERIYSEPDWHSIDARLPVAHPVVQGRSNWLIPGKTTGIFYCLDSYRTDMPGMEMIDRGMIKFVRVAQGLAQNNTGQESGSSLKKSGMFDAPRRVLGTIPVEADGSFQVRVPAEVPINFQLLDQEYVKIREQEGWTWVIGNENRGCIGCHENREFSPPNIMVQAVKQPAHDLTVSSAAGHVVDFRRDIAPIISKSCATKACHGSGKISPVLQPGEKGKHTDAYRHNYEILISPDISDQNKTYVHAGDARNSLLTGLVLPQDPVQKFKKDRTHLILSEEEKRILVEWIDLGAHWDLSAYREQQTGVEK